MNKHFGITFFLLISILMTICILSGCTHNAATLADGIVACERTKKADKQLEKLYALSIQFADQIAESWAVRMKITLAKDFPQKMLSAIETSLNEDPEYLYKIRDFDDEVTFDDIKPDFSQSKFIALHNKVGSMYILGDFYARLPEKNRARTINEVNAILYVNEVLEKRDDYSGSAYNRNYYVYIISLDSGKAYKLAADYNKPPVFGQGVLYGSEITMDRLWNYHEVGENLNYILSADE